MGKVRKSGCKEIRQRRVKAGTEKEKRRERRDRERRRAHGGWVGVREERYRGRR